MPEKAVVRELQRFLNESKINVNPFSDKIKAMQEIYFERNSELYTEEELKQLHHFLEAVSYKYYMANFSLDLLWAMSYTKRKEIFYALQNSFDRLECSNDELLLSSFTLEGFLFQCKSFLDIYMLYICMFLHMDPPVHMTTDRFFKKLDKIHESPFTEKAQWVEEYFKNIVFGENESVSFDLNNWGTLLKSLRDKIAHRDRLRLSFNGKENLFEAVLFDWPTLQDITYDRFCQYMQNGMFDLVKNVSSVLYELQWKPGPYDPQFWKNDL